MCVHVGGEGMSLDVIIQSSVSRSIFYVIHLDSLYLNNLFILAYLVQHLMTFGLNTNVASSE